MNNVFHSGWELFRNVIEWFFPPWLLSEPIVALLLNGAYFVFGMWFLGMLVFKPCYVFARIIFRKFRGE